MGRERAETAEGFGAVGADEGVAAGSEETTRRAGGAEVEVGSGLEEALEALLIVLPEELEGDER